MGWLMMPLPIWVLASMLLGAVIFTFVRRVGERAGICPSENRISNKVGGPDTLVPRSHGVFTPCHSPPPKDTIAL